MPLVFKQFEKGWYNPSMSSYLNHLYDELRKPLPRTLQELTKKREKWRQRLYHGTPGSPDWNLKSRYIEEINRAIEITQRTQERRQIDTDIKIPKVDNDRIQDLMRYTEQDWLDWKYDFSTELKTGRHESGWNKGRGELLKDIVAIANSLIDSAGFLVMGVHDKGAHRVVVGISDSWDDADFQIWAENVFQPIIRFVYSEISWQAGNTIGVFAIAPSRQFPHIVKTDIGGVLHKGQIWFRRGSKNTVALYDDLKRMFSESQIEPMFFERTDDPELEKICNLFKEHGREPVLPRYGQRDSKIAQGYEIVRHPDTNQEIIVGRDSLGKYAHIVMLKPNV